MAQDLVKLLMQRDELSRSEVLENLKDSYDAFNCAEEPEEIEEMLHEDFGLEPDYVMDVVELAARYGW